MGTLPPEVDECTPEMLIVLDDNRLMPIEVELARMGFVAAAVMPLVDDQATVDPDADAVVGACIEAIVPATELLRTRPAH